MGVMPNHHYVIASPNKLRIFDSQMHEARQRRRLLCSHRIGPSSSCEMDSCFRASSIGVHFYDLFTFGFSTKRHASTDKVNGGDECALTVFSIQRNSLLYGSSTKLIFGRYSARNSWNAVSAEIKSGANDTT